MKKRVVALLLVLAMLILAGCSTTEGTAVDEKKDTKANTSEEVEKKEEQAESQEEVSEDVPTIYIGGGKDSENMDQWPTDFVKKMENDLGFKVEFRKVTNEQLDLFLASGTATVDIVRTPSGKENQVVQSGLAVELDPYLEQYGQNILKWEDRNNLTRELLSNGTGKLYFRKVQVGPEMPEGPTELWNGYVVRWDLYKELGAPPINNDDDFIDVLDKMVKLYPTTDAGDKVYGMGIDNSSLWPWLSQFEANDAMSGVVKGAYLNLKDGSLISKYTNDKSPYWRSMEFFNKLYSKGLLDPDSFIMTGETRKERAGKGMYVGAPRTWDVGEYYNLTRKEDSDTLKGFMSVIPEQGGMSAWYGASPVGGWEFNSYYIPTSSAHIDEAVQVLDYLDNPDNLRALYSGEKGVHWDIIDGKAVVTDFGIELKAKGGDEWKKTGISSDFRFLSGPSPWMTHPDGGYLDLYEDSELKANALSPLQKDFADFYGVSYPGAIHVNQVKAGQAISREKEPKDLFMVLGETPADMLRIDSKLNDILISSLPVLIMASPEQFEAEKENVIAQLKKAGAEDLFSWASVTYNDANSKLQAAKDKYGIK